MKQLFISDLHLKSLDDPITRTFFDFISQQATDADELYILGDFFEYWIGDDAPDELSERVAETMYKLRSQHHTHVFFMAGNRDFLLGDDYCQQAGMIRLEEPYKLPGTGILLCHGDAECTADTEYQKVRRMLRSVQWQQDFLSKPLAERIAFAENARRQSQAHQSEYALGELDDTAVAELLAAHDATLLLHGHTHRPGVRDVKNTAYQRLTLSDWDHTVYYAERTDNSPPVLKKFV